MGNVITTISISDDHPHVLYSLKHLFADLDEYKVTNESRNITDLITQLSTVHVDIIITDFAVSYNKSNLDGFAKIRAIKDQAPDSYLILLTAQSNPAILMKTLDYGVRAIVSKIDDVNEIIMACDHLINNEENYFSPSIRLLRSSYTPYGKNPVLTPKELEVVRLFSSGFSLSQIAERQHRTISTISTQKYNAMKRLGISSNTELLRYAYAQGLI